MSKPNLLTPLRRIVFKLIRFSFADSATIPSDTVFSEAVSKSIAGKNACDPYPCFGALVMKALPAPGSESSPRRDVLQVPTVGAANPLLQRDARPPAQRKETRHVKHFPRRAVRFGRVIDDRAFETHNG